MANVNQRYRAYGISVAAALSVVLDTSENPQSIITIFVKSTGVVTFTISGSSDGVTYRDTSSLISAGPTFENVGSFMNAYRYVKVATVAANNNEIEIVGTRG